MLKAKRILLGVVIPVAVYFVSQLDGIEKAWASASSCRYSFSQTALSVGAGRETTSVLVDKDGLFCPCVDPDFPKEPQLLHNFAYSFKPSVLSRDCGLTLGFNANTSWQERTLRLDGPLFRNQLLVTQSK